MHHMQDSLQHQLAYKDLVAVTEWSFNLLLDTGANLAVKIQDIQHWLSVNSSTGVNNRQQFPERTTLNVT